MVLRAAEPNEDAALPLWGQRFRRYGRASARPEALRHCRYDRRYRRRGRGNRVFNEAKTGYFPCLKRIFPVESRSYSARYRHNLLPLTTVQKWYP